MNIPFFKPKRPVVVQLKSLLIHPQLPEEENLRVLARCLEHEGVQALIQGLETEAAYWQGMAVDTGTPVEMRHHYAGGAASLLRILKVLEDLKPQ
jgi:hypothetical protein